MERKSVCIIGGGPAGLVSLRRVLDSPFLNGTIFEQKDEIGGLWNYAGNKTFSVSKKNLRTDENMNGGEGETYEDEDPECTTTMYDDLVCNLPYPLMEFLDFPHQSPKNTFLTQPEVEEYFRKYATNFNLWPHINLNCSVTSVRPVPSTSRKLGEPCRWIVEIHHHKKDLHRTLIFDAVMVCIGKNSYPYQPEVPGLENFKGEITHSKFFKNGKQFKDKRVVLIGLGPSSADLTMHLSKTVKSVTVCHRFSGGIGLGLVPKNVRQTRNVEVVSEDGVVTEDKEKVPCDVIIFCTGYSVKFPFLRESGIEILKEKYVRSLYKMMIFTKVPSLAIINLVHRAPGAMILEAQAIYFVKWLEREELPSYQDMEVEVKAGENEKIEKGWPHSLWFQVGDFGGGTWKYFEDLMGEVGMRDQVCGNWELMRCLIGQVVTQRMFKMLAIYKNDRFRVVGEDEWEYICSWNKKLWPEVKGERVRMTFDRKSGMVTKIVEEIEEEKEVDVGGAFERGCKMF